MRPGHRPLWRDSHGGGSTALIWIKGWPHEISDRPQMRNNDGRPSKRPAVNLPPTAEMICAIDEESARSPQPGELPAAHCHQVVRHRAPSSHRRRRSERQYPSRRCQEGSSFQCCLGSSGPNARHFKPWNWPLEPPPRDCGLEAFP
jgi:hypothetical protein